MRLRLHLPEGTRDWESNVSLFRVGRSETCALRLEGESAKYSSWEHAEIKLDEDGNAYVTDLGSSNGTYVDGVRIAEDAPLWVGATVQIGTKGPRMQVLDLPRPAAAPAGSKAPVQIWQRWPIAVVFGVVVLALAAYLISRGGDRSKPRPEIAESANAVNQVIQKENKPVEGSEVKPPIVQVKPTAEPPPPVPPDPAKPAKEAGLAAYRLVIADDPGTKKTFPLFGAVVVGKHTLLTRATSAMRLAEFMEKKWPLAVLKPPRGTRQAIREIRVHTAFQQADAVEQLFFDEALLYTDEPLDDLAELAGAEELNLELGQPLTCIALNPGREPLNRFQELNPASHPATVLNLANLPGETAGPRLVLLHGDLDDKYFGSPIFNDRGRLVAMYLEIAPESMPGIHYAKLIDRVWIQPGLDTPDKSWVKITTVPPKQSSQEEPAK